jgi:hypothetical protein
MPRSSLLFQQSGQRGKSRYNENTSYLNDNLVLNRSAIAFIVLLLLFLWHDDTSTGTDTPIPDPGSFSRTRVPAAPSVQTMSTGSFAPGFAVTAVLAIGVVYLILAVRALRSIKV